ncbi:hypothetical protein [Paenibacillus tengchongensis]|uniref:hypothetical protein n=1 Tax=Paenibacillus tengchongensis TaxID=2608684 RepID=UPI00124C7B04|nr:hypothetical protein [Paenibacillus tengchongensis]
MIILRVLAGLFFVAMGLYFARMKTVTLETRTLSSVKRSEHDRGLPLVMTRIAGGLMIIIGLLIWGFGFPGMLTEW